MSREEAIARKDVQRLLFDAEGERRNGLPTTDAGLLAEHLVEALTRINELEGEPKCSLTDEKRAEGVGCDLGNTCAMCRLADARAMVDCGLSAKDRAEGGECKVMGHLDLEKCHLCQLAEAKREKDCGASHEEQANRKPCGLASGYLDRCCACELAMKEAGHAEELTLLAKDLEASNKETARLTAAFDNYPAEGKAADTIATLRAEVAAMKTQINCGMDLDEWEAYGPCLLRGSPGGDCDTCVDHARVRAVDDDHKIRIEAATETLRRENEGLRNQIQIVTDERNRAIVEADSRPRAPVRPGKAQPAPGRTLFDLMSAPVVDAPKVAKKPRSSRKKYPLGS